MRWSWRLWAPRGDLEAVPGVAPPVPTTDPIRADEVPPPFGEPEPKSAIDQIFNPPPRRSVTMTRTLTLNCPRCGETAEFTVRKLELEGAARDAAGRFAYLSGTVEIGSSHACAE